eukprot:2233396-Pyramimonas_sp.AAC.1
MGATILTRQSTLTHVSEYVKRLAPISAASFCVCSRCRSTIPSVSCSEMEAASSRCVHGKCINFIGPPVL